MKELIKKMKALKNEHNKAINQKNWDKAKEIALKKVALRWDIMQAENGNKK